MTVKSELPSSKVTAGFKVLIVSQGYPPLDGGVATSTRRIAHSLSLLGCAVRVLTFNYKPSFDFEDHVVREDDEGVLVFRVGPFYRHSNIDENELAVGRRRVFDQMLGLASDFNAHVVLSMYASNSGLLGLYIANALGIPHVAGIRGNDAGRNIFSTRWLSTLQFILQSSSRVACVNDHLMVRLRIAFPFLSDKLTTIRNAVQVPTIVRTEPDSAYVRNITGWPPTAVVAVFIGTPREKKGIGILLNAFKEVSQCRSARLLIVGPQVKNIDCAQYREIYTSLAQEGIIHTTGQLPRDRALAIASQGDLLVMPSLDDGLANGLLEGMSFGLTPIVSDVFNDVVEDQVSGWVVKKGDAKAFASALIEAIDDPDRRQRFAKAAQHAVAVRHSPHQEGSSYLALFQSICSPSKCHLPC